MLSVSLSIIHTSSFVPDDISRLQRFAVQSRSPPLFIAFAFATLSYFFSLPFLPLFFRRAFFFVIHPLRSASSRCFAARVLFLPSLSQLNNTDHRGSSGGRSPWVRVASSAHPPFLLYRQTSLTRRLSCVPYSRPPPPPPPPPPSPPLLPLLPFLPPSRLGERLIYRKQTLPTSPRFTFHVSTSKCRARNVLSICSAPLAASHEFALLRPLPQDAAPPALQGLLRPTAGRSKLRPSQAPSHNLR